MILVSACLAGINTRYDGKSSENEAVLKLINEGKAIPVCPEQLGGLRTPRVCCEIRCSADGNKSVISKDGHNFTLEFNRGAERTLAICKALGIKKAILKSKSPSCGAVMIYDGSFSGTLIEGKGLTAELLMDNGIEVVSESDLG